MTDKTMSRDEVNRILDTCRYGDHLTVTRTNGGDLTSVVSGPALCEPSVSRAVGIDLLNGDPHLVREHDGDIWGAFLDVQVTTPRRARIEATKGETDKSTREARYVRAEETTICPRCDAQPGEQCRTALGRWRRNPHKARIKAMEGNHG